MRISEVMAKAVAKPKKIVAKSKPSVPARAKAAPPAGAVIAKVTGLVFAATRLPPASRIETAGCVPNATPSTAPLG